MKRARYICPAVTCSDENGNLDLQGNRNLYEFLIEKGIDGIIVLGSAGEFFALTMEQKKQLVDLACQVIKGRAELIVGVGAMRIEETVELGKYAAEKGADALILVGPHYFALPPESVEKYFGDAAAAVDCNFYIYNFPLVTGYDVSPEVTLKLLRKHRNIIGYKDTVHDMEHTRRLLNTVGKEFPDFIVLSGYDDNFMHNLLSGGCGGISGLSNLYPDVFADWVKAANRADMAECERLQRKMNKMYEIYDIGPAFVPIVKKGLQLRGVEINDAPSHPFLPLNEEQTARLKALMDEIEAL